MGKKPKKAKRVRTPKTEAQLTEEVRKAQQKRLKTFHIELEDLQRKHGVELTAVPKPLGRSGNNLVLGADIIASLQAPPTEEGKRS
jgi:hypothetical protein